VSQLAVAEARVRGILDSRGRVTVEADLRLAGGAAGRGSAPQAIAPGRRERGRSAGLRLGPDAGSPAIARLGSWLRGASFSSEGELDAELARRAADLGVGADATLAVSQAAWRAAAAAAEAPLHRHLAASAGTTPGLPRLLVNAFSAGIHASERPDSVQAVMATPATGSMSADVDAALRIWAAVERRLEAGGIAHPLGASSGMCVAGADTEFMLAELAAAIDEAEPAAAIGVDVAAEHLATAEGAYRLDGRTLRPPELVERAAALAGRFDLAYLEDPLGPDDEAGWRELAARLPTTTLLVGDDLFATDRDRLDPSLAGGILLKPVQIGTVSGTLAAARRAAAVGIVPCVSHRSGETEDTFVCDLAVAVGARFQKIGGPRRGDRIAKYNRLLGIAAELDGAPPAGVEFASTLTQA
jgi:enolase